VDYKDEPGITVDQQHGYTDKKRIAKEMQSGGNKKEVIFSTDTCSVYFFVINIFSVLIGRSSFRPGPIVQFILMRPAIECGGRSNKKPVDPVNNGGSN
jgi:hypothetical protein